ncbi:hypothetical protein [Leptospira kmetyi]|uniref:Uncharacterized protein n=1 Tax=Leptospira kmetyi TaxID=408139 RepID=A0ABX4N9G3_9LEPT|nr:hypothetical protein [Leptospira kmetyi]PJZ29228.1 hypothetical protein CH378_13850 [Leptospira kmetyi]
MVKRINKRLIAVGFIIILGFSNFAKESKFSSSLEDFINKSKQDSVWEFIGKDPSWMFAKSALIYAILEESTSRLSASDCNNPICFQNELLHWNVDDAKVLGSATQALTGVSIVAKVEKLPNGSFFVSYNSHGLILLFKKIFDDRDSHLKSMNLQKSYDTNVKFWFRNKVSMIREIMQNKDKFRNFVREYRNSAYNNSDFDGTAMSLKIADELVCSKYELRLATDPEKKECDERWIGMLVRRQIDGSLPAILSIINRLLFALDPEEYARGVLKL